MTRRIYRQRATAKGRHAISLATIGNVTITRQDSGKPPTPLRPLRAMVITVAASLATAALLLLFTQFGHVAFPSVFAPAPQIVVNGSGGPASAGP